MGYFRRKWRGRLLSQQKPEATEEGKPTTMSQNEEEDDEEYENDGFFQS
jgi:hypothetical protein